VDTNLKHRCRFRFFGSDYSLKAKLSAAFKEIRYVNRLPVPPDVNLLRP
jgi:hypothetical protein